MTRRGQQHSIKDLHAVILRNATDIQMMPHTAKTSKAHIFIAIALLSSFALSGCGIRGTLKTPPPIWGAEAPATTPAPTGTTDGSASTDTDN